MSYNGPGGAYTPYPPQPRPPQNAYGGIVQSSYGPPFEPSPNVGPSYGMSSDRPPQQQQPHLPQQQQYQQYSSQYPNDSASHVGVAGNRPPPPRPPPDHGPGRGGQGGHGRRRRNKARSPQGRGGRPLGDRGHFDQQANQGPPVRPIPPHPSGPPPPPAPRASESLTVDARIAKERPCRTLFVRNITYETDTRDLLARFEAFGPFQKVFDIIQRRGMLFLTYYDLRAAQKARDAMHNTVLGPRAIDVHYSLPKADELQGKCGKESNQGSVMCTLHLQRDLNEQSLRRCAADYGEVKAILATSSPNQKVVEFYDSRAAVRFVESMDTAIFGEGRLHADFVWDDVGEEAPPPPPAANNLPPPMTRAYEAPANSRPYQSGPQYDQSPYAPPPPAVPPQAPPQRTFDRGPGPVESRPNREFEPRGGRPPFRSGEGPSYGEVRGYAPPPTASPAGHAPASHYTSRVDGYDDRRHSDSRLPDRRDSGGPSRYDRGAPGPSPGPPPSGRYDAPGSAVPHDRRESMPPPPAGRYDLAPPPAPAPDNGKLEEARKIQQLLASLGGPVGGPSPAQQPPAPAAHFSPISQYPPLPSQSYGTSSGNSYTAPQPTYPGPSSSHPPTQPNYPRPPPAGAPAGVSIPPNVLSMMQGSAQPPPQQYGQPGGYGSNPPPPPTSIGSLLQQLGGQR